MGVRPFSGPSYSPLGYVHQLNLVDGRILSLNTAPAKVVAAWAEYRAWLTERVQVGHAQSGHALLELGYKYFCQILE